MKETWAAMKYLGKQIIEEKPKFYSADSKPSLTQQDLEALALFENNIGVTAGNNPQFAGPLVNSLLHPSLLQLSQAALSSQNRFRNGNPEAIDEANLHTPQFGSLIPVSAFRFGQQNLRPAVNQPGDSQSPSQIPVSHPFATFFNPETSPTANNVPGFYTALPGTQNENTPVALSSLGHFPTNHFGHPFNGLPQSSFMNYPYPAASPMPSFFPGIQSSSPFGGALVPYNSPMIIRPAFHGQENGDIRGSVPFSPSPQFSAQPFKPIRQPLPAAPGTAQFKTDIHEVTAPKVSELEPKFRHPFFQSPNVLVSLGAAQNDPNSFRFSRPLNIGNNEPGEFAPILYP